MLENWGEELYFKKYNPDSSYKNTTKVTCNRHHTGDVGINKALAKYVYLHFNNVIKPGHLI